MYNDNFNLVATCVLFDSNLIKTKNVIYIYQTIYGLLLEGIIKGLKPGKHGFHIHQYGDLTDGCKSLCDHFNPYQKHHGSFYSKNRHLGDLGNINANFQGIAKVSIFDKRLSLQGLNGIIGRSIVIHELEDDLGLGNHPQSKTTGNSGKRILCGVIGYASNH